MSFYDQSIENQIRQLAQQNQNPQAARALGETADFYSQNGAPAPGAWPSYSRQLGDYLAARGHNVTYS